MESPRPQMPPVAVVGVGALTPGASDAPGFWRTVLSGQDLITDVPEGHWSVQDYYDPDPSAEDRTYGRRGAFLDPVDFDPTAFGIPPTNIPATDTTQLLALMVAQQVLADAGATGSAPFDRERVSVILGTAALELLHTMSNRMQRPVWLRALTAGGVPAAQAEELCDRIAAQYVPWQEATFPGLLSNVVAGRIANRFDLHGTNYTTDAACAGSLAAVSSALSELALGTADLVVTGGVDTLNDIVMYMCFSKTPALSKTGDCRPFSDAADGTMLGEALVMFALKRLADAERDGDRIYAVIRGIGTSSDGRGQAIYAPVPAGQARALRRTYEAAGYGPDSVELLEAHGTGTVAGDAAEFSALRAVFDESGRTDRQWCALGSVKSQIGHTKSAAGAAGLLKAVFALQHKVLPPTIKVDRPNPELGVADSPLYLNTAARPWIRGDDHPRRASVSSFGFGGTNFHLALEEYVPTPGAASSEAAWVRTAPTELVLLGAESPRALAEAGRRLVEDDRPFAEKARAAQLGFDPAEPARACLVVQDEADLEKQVRQLEELVRTAPDTPARLPGGLCFDPRPAAPGSTALLFSGQGSQYVGMGADLAMHLPQARAAWDRAASLTVGDRPLHRVVFPPPAFSEEERAAQQALLTRTEWAQPALAVQCLAQLGVLRSLGIQPDCLAGHSFGELVALHAAGALDETGLIRLARRRGELMDAAATTSGAMLAVGGAAVQEAARFTEEYGGRVWIANRNSPEQVVLSGEAQSIAELEARLAERGGTARRLQASGAFHTPLLKEACDPFAAFLGETEVRAPHADVYGNADAAVYPADAEAVRARLVEHLVSPVRFADEIDAMYEAGVRVFVEVGAGSSLSRMVADTLGERAHTVVSLDQKGRHGLTALQQALGRLGVAGVPMDLEALWQSYPPPEADGPPRAPRMSFPLSGTNYGAPEPVTAAAAAPPRQPAPQLPAPEPQPAPLAPPVPAPADQPAAATRPAPANAPAAAVLPVPDAPPALPVLPVPDSPPAAPVLPAYTATATAPATAETTASPGTWVHAFEETQRHAAEAHAEYQRLMADTHLAFLQSSESVLGSLMGTAPHSAVPGIPRRETPLSGPNPAVAFTAPVPAPAPPATPVIAPVPAPAPPATPVIAPAPEVVASAPVPPPASTTAPDPVLGPPAGAMPSAEPSATAEIGSVLYEVVAEKTGYPLDILEPHMQLEADLGIDSIKRVEILSLLRRRAPHAPDVPPEELADLRTLGEIATRFHTPTDPPPTTTEPTATADVGSVLYEVVAEKTGYPLDILEPHMQLEADLGIDSIKRVEILSLLRRRAPHAPDVPPEELADLRTLGEIATRFDTPATGTPTAPPVASKPVRTSGDPVPAARLSRSVTEVVTAPVPGLELPGLRECSFAVVDNGSGVAAPLVEELRRHGVTAHVTASPAPGARGLILLGGLRPVDSAKDAVEVNRQAFATVREAASSATGPDVLVTVQDTGGDFGLGGTAGNRAWLGGLSGLARTVAKERPDTVVKAVDCERGGRTPQELARVLAQELLYGGAGTDVGLRADGSRWVLGERQQEAPGPRTAPPTPRRVGSDSVIVATGGARGVTAAALIALAKEQQPTFVLLGRTELAEEPEDLSTAPDETELKRRIAARPTRPGAARPGPAAIGAEAARVLAAREVRATIAALEAAGSTVRYVPVDARNAQALGDVLQQVRTEVGAVTGLVHAAGVLADARIEDKSDEQFHAVFDTKAEGLRVLLDATAQDPLELVCVFSSVAGRFGNTGQSDYAMANEVLAQVASGVAAQRPDCVVRSLAWGPWDGGMVGSALREHFRSTGVDLIPLQEGAAAFVRELEGGPGPVRVTLVAGERPDALGSGSGGVALGALRVAADTRPHLADHAIAGTPVVPMALVLEWFTAAVRDQAPGSRPVLLRDVEVVRGVSLPDHRGSGHLVTVRATRESAADPALCLTLENGARTHYRATADTGPDRPQPARNWHLPAGRSARARVYGEGVLFHGPAFHGLTEVTVGADGAAARVRGMRALDWPPADGRHTDPAAVDAGLQLALLWAEEACGAAFLPMGAGEVRVHAYGPLTEPASGVVLAREVDPLRPVCDLALLDGDGTPLVELLGVSLVRRPDTPVAAEPVQPSTEDRN